jgi:hypothetical protein
MSACWQYETALTWRSWSERARVFRSFPMHSQPPSPLDHPRNHATFRREPVRSDAQRFSTRLLAWAVFMPLNPPSAFHNWRR